MRGMMQIEFVKRVKSFGAIFLGTRITLARIFGVQLGQMSLVAPFALVAHETTFERALERLFRLTLGCNLMFLE